MGVVVAEERAQRAVGAAPAPAVPPAARAALPQELRARMAALAIPVEGAVAAEVRMVSSVPRFR